MLTKVTVEIFIPQLIIGFDKIYIIYKNQKYYLNKKTRYKIMKKIKMFNKNKLNNIKISGQIINNQYGYSPNPMKPSNTIIIDSIYPV